jgi:hypothetical protein
MKVLKYLTVIILLQLVSCATPPEDTPPQLYWPFPPERPRIKFLDYVMGSLDVTGVRARKFKQVLFGELTDVAFSKPSFVAVRNDVMYVTDLGRVHVYNFKKKKFRIIGGGVLRNATGIGVASNGTVYVADSSLRRIVIFKPGISGAKVVGGGGIIVAPGGIAVDEPRGRFFVADSKRHVVNVFSLNGRFLSTIGKRGTGPGEFNIPYDVKVDEEGYIYVLDSGNFRVQILNPEGGYVNEFGSVGMGPGNFARPRGIAVDSQGYIYVVDAAFGNFQIFDSEGSIYLSVGESGVEPGRFVLPWGISTEKTAKDEKIYVVDQMNMRVQIFQRLKYPDEKNDMPPRPSDDGF